MRHFAGKLQAIVSMTYELQAVVGERFSVAS